MEENKIYWFTGQAGAGKTVLAHLLKEKLERDQKEYDNHFDEVVGFVIIDGDDIREIYNNTDYSITGRKKNVELVQKLCLFLIKNKFVPIVCMVSPFKKQRREFCEKKSGVEIFVHCDELRGREDFHVDYYEKPEIDNKISFEINTTGKTNEQSFKELWKILS